MKSGKHKACVDAPSDRIADDAARPGVEDGCRVHKAGGNGDMCDVGDPELVRSGRRHVLSEVEVDRAVMIAVGRDAVPPPRLLKARFPASTA